MFSLKGSNHTHSGDGHDKLMGFMKSTFPLAVYGLQDVFSGYILWLIQSWWADGIWIICTRRKVMTLWLF